MAHEIMQDGDAFRGFLNVQARFDRYSPTNALLIYAQNDKATRLRDFDGWKKQGVYVRRHETGISILEAGDSYVTEDGRTGYYYHVKRSLILHRRMPNASRRCIMMTACCSRL